MSREMQATYPQLKKLIGYSNIGVVSTDLKPSPLKGSQDSSAISLGHLSNLTESKGIGTVIDAFSSEALRSIRDEVGGVCRLYDSYNIFVLTYSGGCTGDRKFRSVGLRKARGSHCFLLHPRRYWRRWWFGSR